MDRIHPYVSSLLIILACTASGHQRERLYWDVADDSGAVTNREALVFSPTTTSSTSRPLVFAFHGWKNLVDKFSSTVMPVHDYWEDAVVVYMQALDPGTGTEWQKVSGVNGDRDLHFFDAVLSTMQANYNIDTNHVYATGFSNGATFLYLLMLKRGSAVCAYSPASAIPNDPGYRSMASKPAMLVVGKKETDALAFIRGVVLPFILELNGCSQTGEPWPFAPDKGVFYPSPSGTPVVMYVHDYGHVMGSANTSKIVSFFKQFQPVSTQAGDFANGGFDEATTNQMPVGWSVVNDGSVLVDMANQRSGLGALQLGGNEQPHTGSVWQPFATETGIEYTVSLWGRRLNDTLPETQGFDAIVRSGSGLDGAALGSLGSTLGTLTNEYALYTFTFIADATNSTLQILDTGTTAADGNDTFIDDVRIDTGNRVRLVHTSTRLADTHVWSTTEGLGHPDWAHVPHSNDGTNAFVVTNLSYSTESGSNIVIYVQADSDTAFFGLGNP